MKLDRDPIFIDSEKIDVEAHLDGKGAPKAHTDLPADTVALQY